MRRKIFWGFGMLALLLFVAGMFSFFELRRLSNTTRTLIQSGKHNIESAKQMLDAVNDQNVALLQMIVVGQRRSSDSLLLAGEQDFEKALSDISLTIGELSELDSIYVARDRYDNLVAEFLKEPHVDMEDWFTNHYRDTYNNLIAKIKSYLFVSQRNLGEKAERLEGDAYRVITPTLFALVVAILLCAMLVYFIDLYFVSPVVRLNKALHKVTALKQPLDVKVEGKDEVFELKEQIEALVLLLKKQGAEPKQQG